MPIVKDGAFSLWKSYSTGLAHKHLVALGIETLLGDVACILSTKIRTFLV